MKGKLRLQYWRMRGRGYQSYQSYQSYYSNQSYQRLNRPTNLASLWLANTAPQACQYRAAGLQILKKPLPEREWLFALWRRLDSNQRPPGYEPDELPLLYSAMFSGYKGRTFSNTHQIFGQNLTHFNTKPTLIAPFEVGPLAPIGPIDLISLISLIGLIGLMPIGGGGYGTGRRGWRRPVWWDVGPVPRGQRPGGYSPGGYSPVGYSPVGYSNSTTTASAATAWPGLTKMRLTVPALSASRSFSIFMAS